MNLTKTVSFPHLCLRIILAMSVWIVPDAQGQSTASAPVTIYAENLRLDSLFRRLESQAEIRFLYSPTLIRSDRKVSGRFDQVPLGNMLRTVLAPLGLTYRIQNNHIIVTRILPPSS